MKKFALGVALGASLISTAALAGEQRPTYLAFAAPAASTNATSAASVAPAAPRVAKRNGILESIPLFVPLVAGLSVVGLVAAFSTGNSGSPG